MTYFTQLKDKHNNPKKAYIEYQLSKKFLRVFAHSENLPEDIAMAMDLQGKLNKYCEALVAKENPREEVKFSDMLGIDRSGVGAFYGKHANHFEFLGIDRNDFINLISGMYEMNLDSSAKNITWESLEEIINSENNNIPLISQEESTKLLKKTVDEYGLQSLIFGRVRATEESLSKVPESLNQLALVVGCDKKQVGANKFNFFFDSEDCNAAGYSTQFFGGQKVYLNERISYDAFAHEWLHSIDNMLAVHHKLSNQHASETNFISIAALLEKTKEVNNDAINKIKEKVSENCFKSLNNLIDRYNVTGSINNVEEFKELVNQAYTEAIDNNWDKKQFIEKAKTYQKEPNAIISYLCSEIELLQKMQNEKLDVSVFYNYAVIMDANLNMNKNIDGDYSTTKLEMFARAFETFTDLKLEEKGVKNLISKSINNYTPSHEETKLYMEQWEAVTADIRDMLNAVCPVNEKENQNNFEVSKVLANINNIRSKNENLVPAKNKMKIG